MTDLSEYNFLIKYICPVNDKTENNNKKQQWKIIDTYKTHWPFIKNKFGTLHNSDAFWIKFILGTFQAIPSLFQNF